MINVNKVNQLADEYEGYRLATFERGHQSTPTEWINGVPDISEEEKRAFLECIEGSDEDW